MSEPIEFRYRPRETSLQGERLVILETEIPDNAPEAIKEGLSRRAIVNGGGTCPCGAKLILPTVPPDAEPPASAAPSKSRCTTNQTAPPYSAATSWLI